jgi:L-fuconolactonase
VIDPAIPICDSHHHLFPGPSPHSPAERYLFEELARDVATVPPVRSTVYVEVAHCYDATAEADLAPVGETRWVAGLARPRRMIDRIVGFVDLRLGAAAARVIDAHTAAADGRFAGVRHSAAWDASPQIANATSDPPPGLLDDPRFGDGLRAVARAGLVYETWVFFHQLPDVARVAADHPDLVIVLDHLGGPLGSGPYRDRRREVLDEWRRGMRLLAVLENVRVKLGGIGMARLTDPSVFGGPPSVEQLVAHWGPEILWCVETFGPQRCMFEGNFPVDAALCDYATLWDAYSEMTSELAADERHLLFHATAEATYGIEMTH